MKKGVKTKTVDQRGYPIQSLAHSPTHPLNHSITQSLNYKEMDTKKKDGMKRGQKREDEEGAREKGNKYGFWDKKRKGHTPPEYKKGGGLNFLMPKLFY